jgi:conjugative relaxase-like TrwC/TraI family protein
MSVAKLSAGSGFEYLMRHTARGDAPDLGRDAMTRYYTNPGYPAGVWLGSGIASLPGGDVIRVGSQVTEEQMARLFGAGHDPGTGTPLGREYTTPISAADRIAARIAKLKPILPDAERAARITAIEAAVKARPNRASVAGFDLTFSVPKSLSVLWALSDAATQRVIVDAHHTAVMATLRLIEKDVARTRIGTNGAARVPVRGIVAAAFDHHDSRAGDPQLHTHVTVANRVQATTDGRWRTLDGQLLYAAAVAHSDTYDLLLADNVTRALGLAWETRLRGHARNPRRELAAVPDHLITEFSQRSAAITAAKDAAIADFVTEHGRQPTGPEAVRIRQQATLATRQPKRASTLAEYTERWAARASTILSTDSRAWARQITARAAQRQPPQLMPSEVVDDAAIEKLAASALDQVEAKRATWSRWNLVAAACRAIGATNLQFTDTASLFDVRTRVSRAAMDRSVLLNPAEPQTGDTDTVTDPTTGRSIYDAPEVFTSLEVLAAEDSVLNASTDLTAPIVAAGLAEAVTRGPLPGRGYQLEPDQTDAVISVCTSGRVCDVLVGAAGTGKTTTMAGLRAAWEAQHGPGSVIGLATSAVAAEVLGTEIDIAAENTAQWLAQQQLQPGRAARIRELRGRLAERAAEGRPTDGIRRAIDRAVSRYDRWTLHPGQLLVLDEAGMADLPTVNALARQAQASGAKLLLVGDHRQLPAIGAGGTFEMLAGSRTDTPHLADIHRFKDPDGRGRVWEARASLLLRRGEVRALDAYAAHGRLRDGDTDAMIDAAYLAWKHDRGVGLNSLLVAADNATVQALNLKARADRIADGHVRGGGAALHDGTAAGVGDRIVTRRVDRRLRDGSSPQERPDEYGRYPRGFVKNGTAFTVVAVRRDGALRVRADGAQGATVLPAQYVSQHVELGYAVTAHRCQGMTVDTTHTIATDRMTREAFYVAMTRGTQSNRAYVTTDCPAEAESHVAFAQATSSRESVLATILTHVGAEQSAHTLRGRLDPQHRHRSAPTRFVELHR